MQSPGLNGLVANTPRSPESEIPISRPQSEILVDPWERKYDTSAFVTFASSGEYPFVCSFAINRSTRALLSNLLLIALLKDCFLPKPLVKEALHANKHKRRTEKQIGIRRRRVIHPVSLTRYATVSRSCRHLQSLSYPIAQQKCIARKLTSVASLLRRHHRGDVARSRHGFVIGRRFEFSATCNGRCVEMLKVKQTMHRQEQMQ